MSKQIQITIKKTENAVGDEPYKIARLTNAVKVTNAGKTFRVGDFLREGEVEGLTLEDSYTVIVQAE